MQTLPTLYENEAMYSQEAKALMIGQQDLYPDSYMCADCPHSSNGRIPTPVPLDENHPWYSVEKGRPGDLCPPCAKQQLADLGHWQGCRGQTFPEELLPMRLFQCRMWLWLVIPGLYDSQPQQIQPS